MSSDSEARIQIDENYRHRGLSDDDIQDIVTYHAPSPEGIERHTQLANVTASALRVFDKLVPRGYEKEQALLHLQEAKFWASAGVARNETTR